jgi:hypothetical protein
MRPGIKIAKPGGSISGKKEDLIFDSGKPSLMAVQRYQRYSPLLDSGENYERTIEHGLGFVPLIIYDGATVCWDDKNIYIKDTLTAWRTTTTVVNVVPIDLEKDYLAKDIYAFSPFNESKITYGMIDEDTYTSSTKNVPISVIKVDVPSEITNTWGFPHTLYRYWHGRNKSVMFRVYGKLKTSSGGFGMYVGEVGKWVAAQQGYEMEKSTNNEILYDDIDDIYEKIAVVIYGEIDSE